MEDSSHTVSSPTNLETPQEVSDNTPRVLSNAPNAHPVFTGPGSMDSTYKGDVEGGPVVTVNDVWGWFREFSEHIDITPFRKSIEGRKKAQQLIDLILKLDRKGIKQVHLVPYFLYFPDGDVKRGEKAKPVIALPFYDDTKSYLFLEDIEMAICYSCFLHWLVRKGYVVPAVAGVGMFAFHDYDDGLKEATFLRNSTKTILLDYYLQALDRVPYDMLNKFHKDNVMRVWPPPGVELQQELAEARIPSVSSSNQ